VSFEVEEEVAYYDLERRLSWQEGGLWPHLNHYNFHEAVVAAYFVLRGYHVLWDYSSTSLLSKRPVARTSSQLFHEVVGPDVSAFFLGDLATATRGGSGQPDLFVFREEEPPADKKVKYLDPRLWFFVEVKGPRDRVGPNQRAFWKAVAERTDLGLGPERIRLFRTAPCGEEPELKPVDY